MKYEMTYIEEKDQNNQKTLIVDTDKTHDLVADWTLNIPVVEWTYNHQTTSKAMRYMVPLNCKNVAAILISTAPIGSLKDRKNKGKDDAKYQKAIADATDYFRTIAEVQIYNGNGIVAPKNGYGNLLEALRMDGVMLAQYDQYNYAKRPDYDETWPLTYEEHLANITAYPAPRHHNDNSGEPRPSMYSIDEQYTNTVVTVVENEVEKQKQIVNHPDHLRYTRIYLPMYGKNRLDMAYVKVPEVGKEHEFGLVTTQPVSAKVLKASNERMRTYLCNEVIPDLGRGVLRDTPSRFGYKAIHIKQEDGHYINLKVTCDEPTRDGGVCGGYYLPDQQGNYVCQNCGIIYETVEADIEDPEDNETEDGEDEITTQEEDYSSEQPRSIKYYGKVGGQVTLPEVEARLAKNLNAWKKQLGIVPQDELDAQAHAHEVHVRHEECKKENSKAKKVKKDAQRDLYENKWKRASKPYAIRCILAYIRDGVTDTAALQKVVPCGIKQYYAYLKELIDNNRITSDKKGRRNTLALVPSTRPGREQYPAKYDGRAKYGNLEYKRGTIQSDVGLYLPKTRQWYEYPTAERELGAKAKVDSDYPLARTETPEKYNANVAKAAAYETAQIARELAARGH